MGTTKYGPNIKYMYELELESSGDTVLMGKTLPTPASQRQAALASAHDQFYRASKAVNFRIYDEEGLHWNMPNIVWLEEYQRICVAAHKIGFAMLCGFPLKLHRQDWGELGRNSFLVLLLKIVEWVRMYGNFKTMAAQVERFMLGRYLSLDHLSDLGYELERSPYTLLRVATTFKAKDLFQYALARATQRYFQDVGHLGVDYAHQVLLQSLGHDYLLVGHVMRLQVKLSDTLSRVHHELLSIRQKHYPRATWGMASTIWRNWYIRNSFDSGAPDGNTILDIGNGDLDVDKIIDGYREVHFGKGPFPPKHVQKKLLPEALRSICDTAQGYAQELFDESGKYFGPQGGAWDLVGSLNFEDYVYPWQTPADMKVSSLTANAYAVAAEAVEENDD